VTHRSRVEGAESRYSRTPGPKPKGLQEESKDFSGYSDKNE